MTFKTITSLSALFAIGAFAAASAGSPADYFTEMDADASGAISQAEYVAHKTAGGKYTAEKAAASFAKMAGDDGELTLNELEGAMTKAKSKADCDKDKARTT